MKEEDFDFVEAGSDSEYEIWQHTETKDLYRVSIQIDRDFENCEKIRWSKDDSQK